MLNSDEREAVASLLGHRGYQLLMREIDSTVEAAVVKMARTETEAELLRVARFFQALAAVATTIRTRPAEIAEELDAERGGARTPAPPNRIDTAVPLAPVFPESRRQLLDQIEGAVYGNQRG